MEQVCLASTGGDNSVIHLNYAGITEHQLGNNESIEESLKKARFLYLKRNVIKHLPKSIGQIEYLQEIHLEGNSIEELPDEIRELKHLQVLNAASNYLVSLPPTVGKLTSLKKLQVSNNTIRHLPHELGNLSKLETLEASRNQLTSLPCDLVNCSRLLTLALDKNRLQVFPRQLCWLKNLTELSLAGNLLEYLPPVIYEELTSMKMLIVDQNPGLQALPPDNIPPHYRKDCLVSTFGCFQKGNSASGRFKYIDVESGILIALPKEFEDCESHVPDLQEITFRALHEQFSYTNTKEISKLPLPNDLKERLMYPTAYCINSDCRRPLFRCALCITASRSGMEKIFIAFSCSQKCRSSQTACAMCP